jgi:hypothetical protein
VPGLAGYKDQARHILIVTSKMDFSKLTFPTYGSPLSAVPEDHEPLVDKFEGKRLLNPPRKDGLSPLYQRWVEGIDPTGQRGGFDFVSSVREVVIRY